MKISDYVVVFGMSLLISVAAVALASAFHMRVETHLLEEMNELKAAQAQQLQTIRRLEQQLERASGPSPQQTSWEAPRAAADVPAPR